MWWNVTSRKSELIDSGGSGLTLSSTSPTRLLGSRRQLATYVIRIAPGFSDSQGFHYDLHDYDLHAILIAFCSLIAKRNRNYR